VVLREIEGMSHREVAKALGISEAASRVRLVRGMERLRRLLREEG
jgi:DNA-directed RNA polymerase specialized sigma24 family protein